MRNQGDRGNRHLVFQAKHDDEPSQFGIEDAPVAEGDQVGRMSEANEPRSGRKSPHPRSGPRDVYWPDENNARIGDEVIWKIEPHETPTRKEATMNELTREVREIIDNILLFFSHNKIRG